MADFICNKDKVREILEFHQLTCPCDMGYPKILKYLESMPDTFAYNEFCSKLDQVIDNKKLIDMGDRFKNGFLLRMRRYKIDIDWKDLQSPMPKMSRAKRIRMKRQAKIININKQNDENRD